MSWICAMWWASAENDSGSHIGGNVVDRRIGECLFVERQEMGIVVDFDGDAVLGPVICHGNLPASGPKLLSVLAVDADGISRYLTNF